MSSDDLADFFVHTVLVETYIGPTGNGSISYAAAVTVPCFLSRKQRFTRNADNETVSSQATVSADVSWAATLAPKSRVTIAGDQSPTTIISREVPTGGDFIEDIDRVKVYLQ